MEIGRWTGSTITDAVIMHAQLSYISPSMTQIEGGRIGFWNKKNIGGKLEHELWMAR